MMNEIDNEKEIKVDESVVKHETLVEAFVYAQMEFEPIVHNCVVDFTPQGKRRVHYTYADLAQTQKALYPALNRHGLSISYNVEDKEGRVSLRIIMSHAFSDAIRECCLRMKGAEETKDLAAEITYLKRYLLGLITGTASEEDSLDQEQDDAQGGDEWSQGKTQPEAEKGADKPAEGSQADESGKRQPTGPEWFVRNKLGPEIGIKEIKVYLGKDTAGDLTEEEWQGLVKTFNKYKTAAGWLVGKLIADEIEADVRGVGEFSQFKAGGWKALYEDIKAAKDGGSVDALWSEYTNWLKKDNVDEEADDLKAAKAKYRSLIDSREGWETPGKRIAQEAKLSKKLYPLWRLDEHLEAIMALEAEGELAS